MAEQTPQEIYQAIEEALKGGQEIPAPHNLRSPVVIMGANNIGGAAVLTDEEGAVHLVVRAYDGEGFVIVPRADIERDFKAATADFRRIYDANPTLSIEDNVTDESGIFSSSDAVRMPYQEMPDTIVQKAALDLYAQYAIDNGVNALDVVVASNVSLRDLAAHDGVTVIGLKALDKGVAAAKPDMAAMRNMYNQAAGQVVQAEEGKPEVVIEISPQEKFLERLRNIDTPDIQSNAVAPANVGRVFSIIETALADPDFFNNARAQQGLAFMFGENNAHGIDPRWRDVAIQYVEERFEAGEPLSAERMKELEEQANNMLFGKKGDVQHVVEEEERVLKEPEIVHEENAEPAVSYPDEEGFDELNMFYHQPTGLSEIHDHQIMVYQSSDEVYHAIKALNDFSSYLLSTKKAEPYDSSGNIMELTGLTSDSLGQLYTSLERMAETIGLDNAANPETDFAQFSVQLQNKIHEFVEERAETLPPVLNPSYVAYALQDGSILSSINNAKALIDLNPDDAKILVKAKELMESYTDAHNIYDMRATLRDSAINSDDCDASFESFQSLPALHIGNLQSQVIEMSEFLGIDQPADPKVDMAQALADIRFELTNRGFDDAVKEIQPYELKSLNDMLTGGIVTLIEMYETTPEFNEPFVKTAEPSCVNDVPDLNHENFAPK